MRLDKYLADLKIGTRSEIKKMIKQKRITVNQEIVKNGKLQIDETTAQVVVDGEMMQYQTMYYYILNKPQGVLSATNDAVQKTVLDLFSPADYRDDLFPVGRLDKDTTGLLLISNDGELAHQLLSPKKHVAKTYRAEIAGFVTEAEVDKFAAGMTLKDGSELKPAQLVILKHDQAGNKSQIEVTIHEGKYHQIKRMFGAVGMKVETLQRLTMGSLRLPKDLALGKYRPLTSAELQELQKN
ncbi:pseudouridine synthase [Ligilactobacillus ceti]|uniref:Pseudouridine synthase n=1 Tax=Ligilactobacillus ceti DSM 22408 TaxID=1122146 RepID=A0A0R2KGU1_9LACO|nr:pseudouridine synthase [Ligilactobacillus ceti]KRN88491.1 rsuA2 protein [Ligilactobacillus ceti DSM 22408]